MKCQYCGNECSEDAAFCGNCGKKFEAKHNFVIVENTVEVSAAEEIKNSETEILEVNKEISEQASEQFQESACPRTETFEKQETKAETEIKETVVTESKPDHSVKGKTFGIIGFIISIEAILYCLVPFANVGALVYSIIGIIFAGISKKYVDFKLNRIGKTLSILALIFSVVTIVLYIILTAILVSYMMQGNGLNFGDFIIQFGKEGFVINIG